MPPYRPAFISQFGWNTRYDDENCAATAGCIALDRHTLGKKHATPPVMRYQTDEPNRQEGLSLTNIEHAWREGWDEDLVNPLPFEPFVRLVNNIRAGRGAIVFGDCRVVREGKRCPGKFPADHALYVNEIGSDGRYMIYDPAEHNSQEGVRWISEETLRRYAENWTINEGSPPGMINAAYTKITGDSGGSPDDPTAPTTKIGCMGAMLSMIGVIK